MQREKHNAARKPADPIQARLISIGSPGGSVVFRCLDSTEASAVYCAIITASGRAMDEHRAMQIRRST